MSTLKPRTPCRIVSRIAGGFDQYGRPRHERRSRAARCAIVYLRNITAVTSVRTDSSASRGNAFETTSDARLLFDPGVAIDRGDIVEISLGGVPFAIEVTGIFPRPDVYGAIHHIEVEGERWESD